MRRTYPSFTCLLVHSQFRFSALPRARQSPPLGNSTGNQNKAPALSISHPGVLLPVPNQHPQNPSQKGNAGPGPPVTHTTSQGAEGWDGTLWSAKLASENNSVAQNVWIPGWENVCVFQEIFKIRENEN